MQSERSTPTPAQDPYGDPPLYDILHSPGSRGEAEALLRIHRELGGRDAAEIELLEPACGSGRLLRPLARRGARIHGFDLSASMLAYAARRLQTAHLFRSDMQDFRARIRAGSIDLAINTINTIRHLESDAALQRHFAEIDHCLERRGVYLVGLSLNEYDVDEPREDQWIARRGRLTVRQLIQYLPPPSSTASGRFEQVYTHLRIERPRGVELRDHHYRLRAYDRGQWERQLARSPFDCVGIFDERGRRVDEALPEYAIFALAKR
jgi:SAM-dependent methyltransferase